VRNIPGPKILNQPEGSQSSRWKTVQIRRVTKAVRPGVRPGANASQSMTSDNCWVAFADRWLSSRLQGLPTGGSGRRLTSKTIDLHMAVKYHHLGTRIASRAKLTTVAIFNTSHEG
jgi:hypothetical protein